MDEYGETDDGLRRGNPLRLDAEKFKNLNHMWLSHQIPDKISSDFDPDHMMYVWDWNSY